MFDQTFIIQAFVTLFLIVDPIGVIPIFMGLMERFGERERMKMVSGSVVIAGVVLLVFTTFGNLIFRWFGISIYAFQIAGGILLLIISIEMLFGKKTRTEVSEDIMAEERENLTISPMAVPLLTGPGAITSGIMLFNSAPTTGDKLALGLVVVAVFVLSYVILRNYVLVYRSLGRTGTKVVVRLMGLILSGIAVQFILNGLKAAFPALVGGV